MQRQSRRQEAEKQDEPDTDERTQYLLADFGLFKFEDTSCHRHPDIAEADGEEAQDDGDAKSNEEAPEEEVAVKENFGGIHGYVG